MLNFVLLVIMTFASLVIIGIVYASINARWDVISGVKGQNLSRESVLLWTAAVLIVSVLAGTVRPFI